MHISRIAIIESLPEKELKTGTRLHEDIKTINEAYGHDLKITLHNIKTKEDFFSLLATLTDDANRNDLYPILHIEIHGDKCGLKLSSGDFISWNALKPYLIKLNIATKLNLFIVLAACYGAYLAEILSCIDRAPCCGLVGPKDKILTGDIGPSYYAFYAELLTSLNGGAAIKKLQDAIPKNNGIYHPVIAEFFFKQVFRKYFEVNCSDKEIESRANEITKDLEMINEEPYIIKKIIDNYRNQMKLTKEDRFKNYKKNFFMIDLYPENAERFLVEYKNLFD